MFRATPENPLFTGSTPLEAEVRIKKRPLGEVSDFVVEMLPDELSRVTTGALSINRFAHTVDLLVGSIPDTTFQNLLTTRKAGLGGFYEYNPDTDLAALDLKMLEAGIVQNGGEAPESLVQKVDIISSVVDQPPVQTYEEVIIGGGYGNPQSDPRVFSGKANYYFLHGHSIIDAKINRVIAQVRLATDVLREHGEDGISQAAMNLEQGAHIFTGTVQDMEAYRSRLDPQDFLAFRKYYAEHPQRGLKGPSGAFTQTVPVLDLSFAGEFMSAGQRQYLIDNSIYFPRQGRGEIVQAAARADQGESLTGIFFLLGRPAQLVEPLLAINKTLGGFRGRHGAVVERQLQDVLKDAGAKGTAGENIRSFLRDKIDTTDMIRSYIKGEAA